MNYLSIFSVLFLIFSSCEIKPGTTTSGETDSTQTPNILFLIADDWSAPHAGAYGDKVVRTPTFDRLAMEGALFTNAYTASPSCTPSRGAILTGMHAHQLESAGNLWSVLPTKFPNWVNMLEENGYFTGSTRKGWAPGNFKKGGYEHNPAGKKFNNFREFYEQKPEGKPFSFWFGSSDPHRVYRANSGTETGMKRENVEVPAFLPDLPCVRNDILDYYFEVERFDRECGQIIRMLEEKGELNNTIIVMTSDNGMPFPRAKANVYDYGTRMPLAIRYPPKIKAGELQEAFMNFVDFAPTFLEMANIDIPNEMSGKSLWPSLERNEVSEYRRQVFLERERHANVRKGDRSYPVRAVRTHEYLYIRNFQPDLWPAGDPSTHQAVGQYGDVDNSITKFLIMMEDNNPSATPDYFNLTFGKRPAEELYFLKEDPHQLNNIAGNPAHSKAQNDLRKQLDEWMVNTNDPRVENPETILWDTVEYVPNYQFHNFDLNAEIEKYKMKGEKGCF